MRNKMIISKTRCAVLGLVSALTLYSQVSVAGTYHSTVTLPTVHSKGWTYQAHMPVTAVAPAGAKVQRVTWNWNVVGFPKLFVVLLCQGHINNCHDVSRNRSGSTDRFSTGNASQPFFFAIRMTNDWRSSPVPVGGLGAGVSVVW
ncbi:MAG: flagellar protein FlhE [Pseudomonas sp.]